MEARIHKAKRLESENSVEDGTLRAMLDLPERGTLEDSDAIFRGDASIIMAFLENHVPQGTRHRLLLIMLEKAKVYYVGR